MTMHEELPTSGPVPSLSPRAAAAQIVRRAALAAVAFAASLLLMIRGVKRFAAVALASLVAEEPTWIELGNVVYGARPDERGPIGGGTGSRGARGLKRP